MDDVNEWNKQVIAEFRENGGKVGGMFEGMPMLILHSTGAKSGLERLNPLAYQAVDGGWAVFGSKAGATTHPDWYRNIVAHPDATIEVGTETVAVRARVTEGDERNRIYDAQKAAIPQFAQYEVSAGDRVIPVVVLERA
ncbi:MAG: nitroreductase/quinone reductase family protein [Ilumatobacter sp.]|uniref:nitroreductase/quinone reductase family protein n=1 Tax=Ilumatobacter sp. TaxID=1967498 RepID=UPI0026279ECD|nr:nitroreductase/quinone reductase family protein [Ilumatobacter sp.]MDJ0767209.1 nitroreductase/quinone reductase family protein [Ilumatobacter sp.]